VKYSSAEEWRAAAIEREDGVDEAESERRREQVRRHHAAEGVEPDADQLADYELYICGKMEMDEYREYLLFKHGTGS